MSHTPGPWSFDESDATIFARITHHYWREGVIASVKDTCAEGKELVANALLLAAAPELLEALRDIVEFCDDPEGSTKPESLAMGLGRLLVAARTAVAKAEGRQ